MSKTTKTKVDPPSPEEKAYLATQQALAQKQLEVLNSQQNYQADYLASVKPLLDQQSEFLKQSVAQQGDYLKALQPSLDSQASYLKQSLDQQGDYLHSLQPALTSQADYLKQSIDQQGQYLQALQPSLDAQTALLKQSLDQQTAAINDPVTKEIQQRANDLLLQQIQQGADLQPLQKQLLQTQLDQALNGNKPTEAQISAINDATNSAYQSGTSDISAFSEDALRQLRENLSPALGLRPGDTPILDRGALVQREATRQAGKLANDLSVANANARISVPLASQQLNTAITSSQGSLGQATQDFQAQLTQAAAANRLSLFGAGNSAFGLGLNGGGAPGAGSALNLGLAGGGAPGASGAFGIGLGGGGAAGAGGAIDSGFGAGIGLANASRENPLSFARGGTSTTSDPWGVAVGLVGGIGGALSGTALSDERTKANIQTDGYDRKGRRWVRFSYKDDPEKLVNRGVIAQEVEKTDPEAVLTDGRGVKYVNYRRLAA